MNYTYECSVCMNLTKMLLAFVLWYSDKHKLEKLCIKKK